MYSRCSAAWLCPSASCRPPPRWLGSGRGTSRPPLLLHRLRPSPHRTLSCGPFDFGNDIINGLILTSLVLLAATVVLLLLGLAQGGGGFPAAAVAGAQAMRATAGARLVVAKNHHFEQPSQHSSGINICVPEHFNFSQGGSLVKSH